MKTSAEIRWFWRDAPPAGLRDWFCHADAHRVAAGGGGTRVDFYLADPAQPELGIKRRGGVDAEDADGPVEVKGLVAATFGRMDEGEFAGPLELWTKWKTDALRLDGAELIRTQKRRWLRRFVGGEEIELDADENVVHGPGPDVGCSVELTEVTLASGTWWTLAFEAFGALDTLQPSARRAAQLLTERNPPAFNPVTRQSYPEWLATHR